MDYTSKKPPPYWRVFNIDDHYGDGLNGEWFARPEDFHQLIGYARRIGEIQAETDDMIIMTNALGSIQIYFLVKK